MNTTTMFIAQADKFEFRRLKQLVKKGEKHLKKELRRMFVIAFNSIREIKHD